MLLGSVLGMDAEERCAVSGGRRGRVRVSWEVASEVPCAERIECTVARVRVHGTHIYILMVMRSCIQRVIHINSMPTKSHSSWIQWVASGSDRALVANLLLVAGPLQDIHLSMS